MVIAYSPKTQRREAIATLEATYIPRKQRTNWRGWKNPTQVTIKKNQERKEDNLQMEDYKGEGGCHYNRARTGPQRRLTRTRTRVRSAQTSSEINT